MPATKFKPLPQRYKIVTEARQLLTGYKVVSPFYKMYTSATNCAVQRVLYDVGHTTLQPNNGGPLAVFNSTEGAFRFEEYMRYMPFVDLSIFECEYEPSSETTLWRYETTSNETVRYRITKEAEALPEGTVLARSVKLLAVISRRSNRCS